MWRTALATDERHEHGEEKRRQDKHTKQQLANNRSSAREKVLFPKHQQLHKE
ncbi:hypothetical protein JOB18_024384, partial [Solea senegalensis]